MIGRRLTARRGTSVGAIAWLLVAALVAGLGFGREHAAIWCVVALAPALIGLAVWVTRAESLSIGLTEEGLDCESPRLGLVPYGRLEGILVPKCEGIDGADEEPGDAFAIVVRTEDRDLVIPPGVDAPSSEVARFLRSRIGASGSRRVHPELVAYLEEQVAAFGEERVWSYRANPVRDGRPERDRVRAVCVTLIVVGLAWCLAGGGLLEGEAAGVLIGLGIWLVVGALVTLLVAWLRRRRLYRRVRGIEEASLVVGPAGLALIQGPLCGEMVWDELRGVRPARRWKSAERVERVVPPMTLKLDGAVVPIYDVYDRPLPDIEARIVQLWR